MSSAVDQETRRDEQTPGLLPSCAGHLLVTEPQNLLQQRLEQLDRGYEELEEANRR